MLASHPTITDTVFSLRLVNQRLVNVPAFSPGRKLVESPYIKMISKCFPILAGDDASKEKKSCRDWWYYSCDAIAPNISSELLGLLASLITGEAQLVLKGIVDSGQVLRP